MFLCCTNVLACSTVVHRHWHVPVLHVHVVIVSKEKLHVWWYSVGMAPKKYMCNMEGLITGTHHCVADVHFVHLHVQLVYTYSTCTLLYTIISS